MSDESLATVARDVASRAEQNDTQYFMAVSPARERVPSLIGQIVRSGIATNYAQHLVVQTPTTASLVYGVMGDTTPGTSFAIQLSVVDRQPRIDQIIAYEDDAEATAWAAAEASASAQALSAGSAPPVATPSAFESEMVWVRVPAGPYVAGSVQPALIGYTNTSSTSVSVRQPLDAVLRLTDRENRPVSTWKSPNAASQSSAVILAPWATVYRVVPFQAPEPGHYVLYGSANGIEASAAYLQTIGRQ